MSKRFATLIIAILLLCARLAAQTQHVPTLDDLLTLKSVAGTQISPDGKWVAYTVGYGDFKQDAFVTQIWLANTDTGKSFQLTRGEKSSTSPRWSPDGQWLAFLSNRVEDKNQIFLINPEGGEAQQLTKSETAINSFAWSEDGKMIAYTATEPTAQPMKDRKDYFGDYDVVREGYSYVHLWTFAVADAMNGPVVGKQRTKKKDFSIDSFSWSPDGSTIAFSATINPDLIQGATDDIYVLKLSDDAVKKVVDQPGPDSNPRFSPDGKQIVFVSAMGDKLYFASNSKLAVINTDGGTPRSITDSFDENPGLIEWNRGGIYFAGSQKTAAHLFRVDPATAKVSRVSQPDDLIAGSFSFARSTDRIAFAIASPTSINEVFVSDLRRFMPRKLSDLNDQTKAFTLGTREVISWKSQDGATIEGILIKPANFDPTRKYPLLCIIHGGPTGIDRPVLLTPDARYYPSDIWAARGALILKVNYRGSAGYGEKFRKLNMRNLGVGDAWDVLSGIDYLIAKGWVDKNKVACMGWSQGGYISAFLTTSTDRFVAISVGAGISNWATYYYNTDITPFTINYLGNDPAMDPEIYQKTSPMSYIKGAKTPTLIQHGELDRRVPIANAYELRQGLEDRGVKVEMVVYKGFGHGITKPKSQRAVMQHNLAWFNHYIWGDPLPDFTAPEVPKKDEKKADEKR
ncbi:MAG TPA: S9 family peptidase [Pyrinomonadaceae bacterium]|jgi:dipeptidyl aminopeptidase/acylaminoacyl peptidase|nr:S9 family peptidase [Pyrinomonadaceae bacterium]